ncbi:MAG: hypothetical protein PHY26_01925, partial [Bacilli bacterium]|nr:hypothetical protein [Bacilli bacterium]
NNVNTAEMGEYTVVYRVSDSGGNEAIKTRVVLVVSDYDEEKGVNRPKLAQGMVPIKWVWNEVNEIWEYQETTENDSEWYEYGETEPTRRWANAVSKDTGGDITAYWVWIPRYTYKITSCWNDDCDESAGNIEISFSRGTDDTRGGTINIVNTCTVDENGIPGITNCATDSQQTLESSNWSNHPAFTFGLGEDAVELTGFWVGKFEVSSSDPGVIYGGGNTTGLDIKVLPGITSWRCNAVGNMFIVSRNMETKDIYGWNQASGLQTDGTFSTDNNNVDTHMMKNIEWGAVAYLSQSIYGKKSEIYINPSSEYLTGFAGTGPSVGSESTCPGASCFAYNTEQGQQASTTGTVYGVYDMSGGANEYTAAYINNSNADAKYKDVYNKGTTDSGANNYIVAIHKKGDAVYETSLSVNSPYTNSWYSDSSYMPYSSNPWFLRGGNYSIGSYAGVFYFSHINGDAVSSIGWRVAALVGEGL